MLRFLVFKNYAAIIEDEARNNNLTESDRVVLANKAMDYYLKVIIIIINKLSVYANDHDSFFIFLIIIIIKGIDDRSYRTFPLESSW